MFSLQYKNKYLCLVYLCYDIHDFMLSMQSSRVEIVGIVGIWCKWKIELHVICIWWN